MEINIRRLALPDRFVNTNMRFDMGLPVSSWDQERINRIEDNPKRWLTVAAQG